MKVKTRDRILSTSLALFNDIGEPNVTTLLISEELEISPGNLYYHFRSKSDIVHELYDQYLADIADLLAIPEDVEVDLEQLAFFLHLLFETLARYRFLYQDLVNILTRYDELQKSFRKILQRKEQGFRILCHSLQRQQLMTTDDRRTEALCQQLAFTVCYWHSYDRLWHLREQNTADTSGGVYQVLSLLMPHLRDDARQQLALIADDYRTPA